GHAEELEEMFADHSISTIYLNFSDPWPKKGHHRRRLTAPDRLDTYKKLLVPGGKIIQKTDNVELFEYSVEEYRNAGLTVEFATTDLHNSSRAAENITTEYEENFMREGKPICCVIVSTAK
ncbi:MAG: tRNA (guanosine(46)-N7)-methyltransferase TrmB, partial [Clostridia bacterium]|nr:tRNA (guanosine(46)-N7)-methyltransferase TrmB [Clostridia bacterium]